MLQQVPASSARVLIANLNRYDQPYPVYPLSLAYLEAALTEAGHEVRCWDAKMAERPLEEEVQAFKPHLVGLSLRNVDNVQSHNPRSFVGELLDCCRSLRTITRAPLVLGGSGFSVFPREFLSVIDADFGIAGEGERALVELLAALGGAGDHRSIPGLVWREADGRILLCPRSPNGELFTVKPRHDPELLSAYVALGSIPGVQTQRGCPLRCCYCTYPLIEGKKSRFRSGEEVVEEMRSLKALGVNYTFIVDSVFNTSREHTAQVCEALASAELGMEWGCFLRPRNVNRELLALMQRAGMKHLEFGSDTLSDPVMKSYGKSFTWEEVRASSLYAHELGIHYSHFIIFGGPGETPATLEETLRHSAELTGSFFFGTIGMRIYPDTPLWRHLAPEKRGESAADFLLQPRFHVEPPLSTHGIYTRLQQHREGNHNWVVGDPPQEFNETIDKLRRRGARGPMWEYVELLQRLEGAKSA